MASKVVAPDNHLPPTRIVENIAGERRTPAPSSRTRRPFAICGATYSERALLHGRQRDNPLRDVSSGPGNPDCDGRPRQRPFRHRPVTLDGRPTRAVEVTEPPGSKR